MVDRQRSGRWIDAIERSLFGFIWKYSKRDQLVLLALTAALFPLLYLTLELPKRIINDAIGASVSTIEVFGVAMGQVQYLVLLCGAFLVAVLGHGLMKMRINTMKGILAERMLRRFRYTLIARMLRFPTPYFQRTSQGELVSMVTSEAEPLGGMMGDAISQPVLQAGQMLTILGFLFLQSFWFGLAACALIPLQAWLIPKLQRQINKLNKERIREVRQLASEIGESAAGAGTLRANGGWRFRLAQITDRLGHLFGIRLLIYKKKFFMKFLNNFIGQLTPFFFFLVGGYLVIIGNVSIGALVAALSAYKDLSSPWKELLTYYNQAAEMSQRWELIVDRFAPDGMVKETLFEGHPENLPRLNGDIVFKDVTVRDADGIEVLEDINATFPAGSTVAIAAANEEDRRAFAELITREIVPTSGSVEVAGQKLSQLHQAVVATRIGHASSRPYVFHGTFGDNLLMPLKCRPVVDAADDAAAAELQRQSEEAVRAGNSPDVLSAHWLDPGIAGHGSDGAVRDWWLRLVEGMGSDNALLRRGIDQSFDVAEFPELAEKLVELRPLVRERIAEAGLEGEIYPFDMAQYNPALPVADNLMFATRRGSVTQKELAASVEFVALLRELDLDEAIYRVSVEVVEMLRQTFGIDGTDHPLFRKLGLDPETYEQTVMLADKSKEKGPEALEEGELALLMTIPFQISADQIGPAFSDELKEQILDVRRKNAEELQERLKDLYDPLDPGRAAAGLTVLENAIFGKLSSSSGPRADGVRRIVGDALEEAGLRPLVAELIYRIPTGIGGTNLAAQFLEPLSLSRASIKRPDILVLDRALVSYDASTRAGVQARLRELLPETTIILLEDRFDDHEDYDVFLELHQGRLTQRGGSDGETGGDRVASADLARKVRALEGTDLFASLDRQQLRLLAFGARWYEAAPDEYVFHMGDDASDGAYLVLEGEAGLYFPDPEGEDKLIATAQNGSLVGELGLIRKAPRALDMKAHTPLTALRIGEEEFLAVVENDASIAFRLLQVVAGYLANPPKRDEDEDETES